MDLWLARLGLQKESFDNHSLLTELQQALSQLTRTQAMTLAVNASPVYSMVFI